MRHEWIFDVLIDLKAYAAAHGMLALARKAEEALDAARTEVGTSINELPAEGDPSTVQRSH